MNCPARLLAAAPQLAAALDLALGALDAIAGEQSNDGTMTVHAAFFNRGGQGYKASQNARAALSLLDDPEAEPTPTDPLAPLLHALTNRQPRGPQPTPETDEEFSRRATAGDISTQDDVLRARALGLLPAAR